MRPPMRPGFPPRQEKHGIFPRTRNGFSQPGRVSMTTLYRLPPRATPLCAGSPVTKRNRTKMHWISGHAHPEPSARMNTDYSIYLEMSGNGRTPALFGNHLMQRAGRLALRPPIAGAVEGEHRTYVTDFVRDARGGGCSVGKPPSNFGFRLVREDKGIAPIASVLRRLMLKF